MMTFSVGEDNIFVSDERLYVQSWTVVGTEGNTDRLAKTNYLKELGVHVITNKALGRWIVKNNYFRNDTKIAQTKFYDVEALSKVNIGVITKFNPIRVLNAVRNPPIPYRQVQHDNDSQLYQKLEELRANMLIDFRQLFIEYESQKSTIREEVTDKIRREMLPQINVELDEYRQKRKRDIDSDLELQRKRAVEDIEFITSVQRQRIRESNSEEALNFIKSIMN